MQGSSKSGYLGEASIDFAYLSDTTKPVLLSMPLQASDSGAILHVNIQKLEGGIEQRCFEEDESANAMSYDRSLETDLEDTDQFEKRNPTFTEEEDDSTAAHHQKQIGNSEMPQSENTTACQDFTHGAEERHQKVLSDYNQRFLNQTKMLERKAEMSELELQSLRKQILKEGRKVEEMSREIASLKKERDILKAKEPSPQGIGDPEVPNNSQLNPVLEEIKQELHREKHLNRKLRFQLQKTEDSNSELILAVRDLKNMLNKKNMEISHISSKIKANRGNPDTLSEALEPKMDQSEEINALEKLCKEQSREDEVENLKQEIANLNNEIELCRKEKEDINNCLQLHNTDYEFLKKEKADIYFDLEKKQASMVEMQQEYKVSLDTVKQLTIQKEKLEVEIMEQTILSSKYVIEINDLETQVQSLEEELEKQAQDFEHDLKAVTQAKVKLEERAKQAEETIEKVKRSNDKQVEHLKAEFARTIEEMTYTVDENKKLTLKAVAEANELLLQNENLEKLLQEAKDELGLIKDVYEKKLREIQLIGQLSPAMNEKNNKFKTIEGHGTNEAQPTDSQIIKGVRRGKMEGSICNEDAKQKEKYEEKPKEIYSKTDILQSWSKEKEELKRELVSARKDAEKLIKENINLRTLIDEKKRTDELLHLDMKKLSVHNQQRHCSPEVNLENKTTNCQLIQSKEDTLHIIKQETRLVDDAIMDCRRLEGRQTTEENICSREMGVLKGNTEEGALFGAPKKGNTAQGGRVVKTDGEQANNNCNLANLLNEVRFLKEQNEQKDVDLKEMQERYSEISLRFAEVEGERQQLVMAVRNLKNGKKK